jgi:hypothetical protein
MVARARVAKATVTPVAATVGADGIVVVAVVLSVMTVNPKCRMMMC